MELHRKEKSWSRNSKLQAVLKKFCDLVMGTMYPLAWTGFSPQPSKKKKKKWCRDRMSSKPLKFFKYLFRRIARTTPVYRKVKESLVGSFHWKMPVDLPSKPTQPPYLCLCLTWEPVTEALDLCHALAVFLDHSGWSRLVSTWQHIDRRSACGLSCLVRANECLKVDE